MQLDWGEAIAPGDRLRLDLAAGRLDNLTRGETFAVTPVPPHLMAMIEAGGLMAHLKERLKTAANASGSAG